MSIVVQPQPRPDTDRRPKSGSTGIRCPGCGALSSAVVDSRQVGKGESIRRRRCCLNCDRRFTTYERVEVEEDIRDWLVAEGGA